MYYRFCTYIYDCNITRVNKFAKSFPTFPQINGKSRETHVITKCKINLFEAKK